MIPSDDAIRAAMEGINIGAHEPVRYLKTRLLDVAVGYGIGSTMKYRLKALGLVTIAPDEYRSAALTLAGIGSIYKWFQLKE